MAQDAGYDNINLDLMFALPGQDAAMARHDVERAIALSPTHISYYHLTMEPNTVFAAKPPPNLPDEDAAWTLQEQGQAMLAEHRFQQYEISAYAKTDRQCAHNLNYWRYGGLPRHWRRGTRKNFCRFKRRYFAALESQESTRLPATRQHRKTDRG